MRRRSLGLLFLVACSHPQASTTPPVANGEPMNAAPASQCQPMADHLMTLLTDDAKGVPPATVKQVHDLFAGHCEKDAWSTQTQQCFLATKTKADGDKCADLLTQAQKDAIEQSADQKKPPAPPHGNPCGGQGNPCGGSE
jgi:hypothetical protein